MTETDSTPNKMLQAVQAVLYLTDTNRVFSSYLKDL